MLAGMRTIWGIHNDRKEIDPAQDKAVRIGWDEIGDLSELEPSREAFKSALGKAGPAAGEATIPVRARTLYRNVHKIKVGTLIVCPHNNTLTIRISQVSGPYDHPSEYPFYI